MSFDQPFETTGYCADCDCMRQITQHGFCYNCGSESVFVGHVFEKVDHRAKDFFQNLP